MVDIVFFYCIVYYASWVYFLTIQLRIIVFIIYALLCIRGNIFISIEPILQRTNEVQQQNFDQNIRKIVRLKATFELGLLASFTNW